METKTSPIDVRSPDSELPTYSGPSDLTAAQVEHRYQLQDAKGREWLWLTVKSRANSPKSLPLFYNKDRIVGAIEVDFDKADGPKAVCISVSVVLCPRSTSLVFSSLIRRTWWYIWIAGCGSYSCWAGRNCVHENWTRTMERQDVTRQDEGQIFLGVLFGIPRNSVRKSNK